MGDLFGAQQSGEPTFRIADPLKDEALFAIARAAAEESLASDPDLRGREHAPLRAALGERYRRAMELFRVG
jgi:ATP-dependent DNA helicase RecG